MNFSSKVKEPDFKPKERLTLKGLMNKKLSGFLKAGAFQAKGSTKFKGPKLKIPRLGR